ncbi:hypothetical protein KAOT1_02742 [Kordia algicida OT-1]|uniref:CHAT domain-containing protein n=1 Tax=Kordia algicida OT-1 TaxID=391587 RepID=A9DUH3_9FLAO|nr:hypothetical protein KAOT1_02742 [Kordia algicida OT-1]
MALFICFQSIAHGQHTDLSATIDSINQFAKPSVRIQKFNILIDNTDIPKTPKTQATLFYELARSYNKAESYEKALLNLTKAIQIQKQLKHQNTLNKSLYLKASVYQKLEQTSEAYALLLQIVKANGADKYTCNSYRKLANIERERGDYYRALQYLNTGISNKKLSENKEFKSLLSSGIIAIYSKIYETSFEVKDDISDLAIVKARQKNIEDHLDFFQSKPKMLAGIYTNLAIVYDSFQELENALKFYKKAQKIYKENGYIYEEWDVALNIAIVYSRQQKHQLANQIYQRIIEASDDADQKANAYNSKGYYLNTEFSKEKLPYLEKAVIICSELDTQLKNNFRLPTLSEIKTSGYEQEILVYLIDLADHYVQTYKEEKDQTYLYKAKETVILIDQLVSLIRYNVDAEASKLFWIKKGVNIYMLAVEICYRLHDVESAFYFMENNKALLLQENIKTFQSKLASNIPRNLLEREYKLNYEVLNLQTQFQQEIDNQTLRKSFADKKAEFQTFMDSMQRAYPKYTKTKEKVAIVSLQNVMETCTQQKAAFVEYILHETDGYGIYYDGENPEFFKIENTANFQQQLKKLKMFMTKRFMNSEALKTYQTIGFEVFQQLFPFKNASRRLQNKKLTIVADQNLQYLPFELIPMKKEGKLSDAYLVNTVETSYVQSFSLFEQIQKKQNAPTEALLVIAPNEFEDKELPALAETTEVLEFLSEYENSVLLTRKEASKENFIKHRNNFNIIHVNTHAGLDSISKMPWLAFYKEKITLTELFGLENQADLVILDACKTNDGVNLSGEGIINLSRGFFYNGTQSVLASQWNVNEQAGNEILQTFYTELNNGNSKSKALQLAKKAYLQKHQNTQNTPYYWAAFTLTGSTDVIMLPSKNNNTIFIIGAILFILIILFFGYRKKILK